MQAFTDLLGLNLPHPLSQDLHAIALAIGMTDPFCRPATNGINDVCRTLHSSEAVSQTVSKPMDHKSFTDYGFDPLV